MSRDYFAVLARMFRLPKFRRLSESQQLTLLYVWAAAGDTDPEATWASAAVLADVLELQDRPAADIEALVTAG